MASLALLTLPPELRIEIFHRVFDTEHGLIELDLYRGYTPSPSQKSDQWRAHCLPRWRRLNWTVYHPLFLVSHQISAEARSVYHITLKIVRELPARLRKVSAVGNESLELDRIFGYAHQDFSPHKAYSSHLRAQAGVYNDDFRGLLNAELRRMIRHVRLKSVYGFDGRVINRNQFPRLECVTFMGYVKYLGSKIVVDEYTSGSFGIRACIDPGIAEAGDTCALAMEGEYDERYSRMVWEKAKWFTFRHVGRLRKREFGIRIEVSILMHEEYGGLKKDSDLV